MKHLFAAFAALFLAFPVAAQLNSGTVPPSSLLSALTISSGFGTGASVSAGTSSVFFKVNVGTGGVASSGVIGFTTAAPNGWACEVADTTTPATNNTAQTASTTNSVTFTNYSRTTGLAAAWPASDVLTVACHGG